MPTYWANLINCLLASVIISPFLRAMIMKKNHSDEFKNLWTSNRMNRLPLIFTILVRIMIAMMLIMYLVSRIVHLRYAALICLALIIIIAIILSRRLKHRSIYLERLFIQNLRSRDIAAQVKGQRRPLYEDHLLNRDVHIGEFLLPEDSLWAGQTLQRLQVGNRFGIHVSSILRGSQRLNIPGGSTVLFPGDRLQAIGNDGQLRLFGEALQSELHPEDPNIEQREMVLKKMLLRKDHPLVGKTLKDSGIRDFYNCMVVGIEDVNRHLDTVSANRIFREGDIIWVVGERSNLQLLGIK